MAFGEEGAVDATPEIAKLNNFTDFYQWIRNFNK
jgi:hypothetical protein